MSLYREGAPGPWPDKVVLITGASSGIGKATAETLADRGARLVLGARNRPALAEIAERVGVDRAAVRATDVTKPAEVEALVALARERFGRLDGVFANAGLGGGGSVASGAPEEWPRLLMTNVYGVALTIHYALKLMLSTGDHGHVVLASSVAGRVPVPGNDLYSASKFALTALAEGVRRELAGRVTVTLIEPGAVDTPFFDGPLPFKALTAEDVAELVAFCFDQPRRLAINELLVRPVGQVD